MATAQETFDKVVKHLRKQRRKSMASSGTCKYILEEDGKVLMCAVGCLIDPNEYRSYFEGNDVAKLMGELEADSNFMKEYGDHFQLLDRLQSIHDSNDVSDWEVAFVAVARDYNLTVPPIE